MIANIHGGVIQFGMFIGKRASPANQNETGLKSKLENKARRILRKSFAIETSHALRVGPLELPFIRIGRRNSENRDEKSRNEQN